jgi:hypothetical protein
MDELEHFAGSVVHGVANVGEQLANGVHNTLNDLGSAATSAVQGDLSGAANHLDNAGHEVGQTVEHMGDAAQYWAEEAMNVPHATPGTTPTPSSTPSASGSGGGPGGSSSEGGPGAGSGSGGGPGGSGGGPGGGSGSGGGPGGSGGGSGSGSGG